jgi:hypothetical protein
MSDYVSLAIGSAAGAAAFIWMLVRIHRHNQMRDLQGKLPFERKPEEVRHGELVGHM